MRKALAALVGALITALLVGPATAQETNADKVERALQLAYNGLENGFKESDTCPVKYSHWTKPFSHSHYSLFRERKGYDWPSIPSLAILTWYYSGAEAIVEADEDNLSWFAKCFDGQWDCGIKRNKRITKAFTRPFSMEKSDYKAIRKYFADPPPPAAVAYASRTLGRCFGDDPAQPSMESMGFVLANVAQADCADLQAEDYDAWNQHFHREQNCSDGPVWVPQQALDYLAEKKAREYAFANRSIEERVGGLNGCQIAYSLIFYGLNGNTVGRIPDGAISWALDYEQAVIDDLPCPIMPKELSDWVQAQPLDKFEPAPDPFDFFMSTGPNYTNINDQAAFVSRVMKRYETAADPQIQIPADYCEDFHKWLAQSSFSKPGESRPERKFLYQYSMQLDYGLRPALCVAVPRSAWNDYSRERSLQAARAEAAQREYEKREAARRAWDAEMDALLRWKPSYRPPASEPRCYRTGENTETCFYN